MTAAAPFLDLQTVLGVPPCDARVLMIGASTVVQALREEAAAAGFTDVGHASDLDAAEHRNDDRPLNLIVADAVGCTGLDLVTLVRRLGRLSPASAPALVCIVETEEQRGAVLRNGGHNAWLVAEQAAFPDRLAMNARVGQLQHRLVLQHAELTARINSRTGRLERAIGVLRQAEARLQAELEQSRAASHHKSEFIAHISHELRNPLNAISGFSEIMLEEMFGPLGHERYRSHARTVHAAAQHLLSIVNGLLDLSKAESGKLEMCSEPMALQSLVQDTVELLSQQAADAGVTLGFDVESNLPQIESDPGKIRQILINLVSNAIKFTPTGGSVTISAQRDEAAGVMILVVTDSGVGIAPHDLDRIMQPYVQAPNSLARSAGTGLGLPITKQFVELLGGQLDVASEVGAGTVFTIHLPLRRPGAPSAPTALSAAPTSKPASGQAQPAAAQPTTPVVLHPVVRRAANFRQ